MVTYSEPPTCALLFTNDKDPYGKGHGRTIVYDGFKLGWNWNMNHLPRYIPNNSLSRIQVKKGN